ncbi:MAG: AMP-binding protein [Rhizobiaceae bacterium]
MLQRADSYDGLYRDFRWQIPERFNIGVAVSDRWAAEDPDRIALHDFGGGADRVAQQPKTLSFRNLSRQSNALASSLRAMGIVAGDRVALLLPQSFETVIAHVAVYKLGAIAVPLALLFGPEALEFRLRFSGAKVVFTNSSGARTIAALQSKLPDLQHVVVVGPEGAQADETDFVSLLNDGNFSPVDTAPDDPTLMIFTSGTTGPPKGALHGHRVLLGHLPGYEMAYNFFPQADDVMWTPADWAWAGGLLNALLPALYHGVPVAFGRFERFNPATAFDLMQAAKVTCAFLPPTALRMMKNSGVDPAGYDLRLRAVMSAGEQLGRETYEWAERAFGFAINEFYGQTECNLVLGSCAEIGASRAGATGKAVPGHRVAVIDADGTELPRGQVGQIAVQRPDPVMFLGYWQDEAATAKKFVGGWMATGDQGHIDEEGYFHFFGRNDDVITSAGYRIGPGEIEDCLSGHPAVALAAAVGKPDTVRTEIVKAYIVLRDGFAGDAALAADIKQFVRARLSAHEYPREVEFVSEIPLTTSGKVIRRVFREMAREEAQRITA